MNKCFLILPFLAFAAYGQQITVAVLPSDGTALNNDELEALTDKMRLSALKILPTESFVLLKQDVVIRRLGGAENYIKECSESTCIVNLGKKAQVDYVAQASVGKLGNKIRLKVELYNVRTEGLIGMLSEEESEITDLFEIVEKKVPTEVFSKILGASGGKTFSPSFAEGIGGVQIKGSDYEFKGEKRYLANIMSNPEGASLSFNGIPDAHCTKTPCSVELREGSVRIIANMEQYDIADTTVSIKQNNQNINIRLKANFGVLEIKPAYLGGIGEYEQWSLTINGKASSSFTNRLSPNKYSVELSHRCYEAISFEAGINKDKREVFDIANFLKLKKGGLILNSEQNGKPISEPVYVNGVQAGETPFSGSVPVCAEINIGENREKVNVKLKHNDKIEYTVKSNYEQNYKQADYKAEKIKPEQKPMRAIRLGVRGRAGMFEQNSGVGSQLFDKSYAEYEEMEKPLDWNKYVGGQYFIPGLMLNIRLIGGIAVAAELNYSFVSYDIPYGGEGTGLTKNFAKVSISYQTIEVPILLRYFKQGDGRIVYYEAGYQLGFPVNSEATVSSGTEFSGTPFKDKFSDFRVKQDKGIVLGYGIFLSSKFSAGLRFIYPLTKLDKYETINAPSIISVLNMEYSLF